MLERYGLAVYTNGTAAPEVRKLAASIQGPGILHVGSEEQYVSLVTLPPKTLVCGGEHANLVVIGEQYRRKMLGREELGIVGFLGGGTQNVLFKLLKDDCSLTLEQFLDMSVDKPEGVALFRPGQVGETIFNNQFGVGAFPVRNGEFDAALRYFPRKLRPLMVRAAAGLVTLASAGEKLDIFSVVPRIGKVNAFPEQDSLGSEITHARIIGDYTALKLALTLLIWSFKGRPPQSILNVTQAKEFPFIPFLSERVWIDGNLKDNPARGIVCFKRTEWPIAIAAVRRLKEAA